MSDTEEGSHREALRRAVHDVRNPLAVLRASLGWLEAELAGNPHIVADVADALRDSSLATTKLVRIADDLALLTLLHEPAAPVHVPVVLGPIVDAAALASTAGAPEGTTVVVMPRTFDEAWFTTTGDVALLTRAIEASVEAVVRGAAVGSRIEIVATIITTGLEIVVAAAGDVGPFTEHDTLTGYGLALHVASRIASAHGGALEVMGGARAPRIQLTLAR